MELVRHYLRNDYHRYYLFIQIPLSTQVARSDSAKMQFNLEKEKNKINNQILNLQRAKAITA